MIIQKNNHILREPAKHVTNINSKEVKELIKNMAEAMFAEPDGIGIAAPQIGISLRIFLVAEEMIQPKKEIEIKKTEERQRAFLIFINPVLKKKSVKKLKDTEGCLSIRGIYGEVVRPEKVTIEYYDELGKKRHRGASGLFARVLQHEMDHLDGLLFIDKANKLKHLP